MDTTHFKRKLIEKERELMADLARIEGEARVSGEDEVKDFADEATTEQGVSETLEEGTILRQTLQQVRDALIRVKDGTYGKCAVCGRSIEPARLEAVPWALYCLADQKKQDARTPTPQGSTL
jgi:RNA polymerase-binding transcription factor DksA